MKGLAHALNPIVMIGNNGLTDTVLREIALSLAHHELIKVKVNLENPDDRRATMQSIAQKTGASSVQIIGKIVVLYLPSKKKKITLPR